MGTKYEYVSSIKSADVACESFFEWHLPFVHLLQDPKGPNPSKSNQKAWSKDCSELECGWGFGPTARVDKTLYLKAAGLDDVSRLQNKIRCWRKRSKIEAFARNDKQTLEMPPIADP